MVFVSNPFEPVTSLQQPKEVTKKGHSLPKFSTAKNDLFLNFKGGKSVVEPLEQLSAKPMLLIYPRIYVRQLFVRFSRSIYMDVN
jgi:hypothetical protein